MVKDNVIKDRLLVISDYRVFFIRRNKMGKKKVHTKTHQFEQTDSVYGSDGDIATIRQLL